MQFKEIQQHLRQYTIGIAGAGGLGSNCAVALCRSGIGRLVIADHDLLEERNLNRQYYFRDQVGRPKVEALKELLERIDPECTVLSHRLFLGEKEILELFAGCDILIEAFDDAGMKEMLINTALQHFPQKPVIAGSGLAGWEHAEKIRSEKIDQLYICGDFQTEVTEQYPPLAPKVSMVANLQANVAVSLLMQQKKEE